MKKQKKTKNPYAVEAHFKNSAGPMKNKKRPNRTNEKQKLKQLKNSNNYED